MISSTEAQKKKTTRLEMVPHRGLVHPWLAEPVWAPDNPWPLRPENNHLRMNEDHEDPSKDRHRDKVSFSQEVMNLNICIIVQRKLLFFLVGRRQRYEIIRICHAIPPRSLCIAKKN